MKPTRIPVAFSLGLTALLTCLALYSGTTKVGPLLGQGPFDVKVSVIVLVCIGATAGIAWSFYSIFHGADDAASRTALQSAALTALFIAILVIATIAANGSLQPLLACMVAVLLILASIAAVRCIDSLAQGREIGFESHWGGLGGGGGGWRLLPPTALALLALSFIGSAVTITFGSLKIVPKSADPVSTSTTTASPTTRSSASPDAKAIQATPAGAPTNASSPGAANKAAASSPSPSPISIPAPTQSKPKLPPPVPPASQPNSATGSARQ